MCYLFGSQDRSFEGLALVFNAEVTTEQKFVTMDEDAGDSMFIGAYESSNVRLINRGLDLSS
jgi:hypothetical protein